MDYDHYNVKKARQHTLTGLYNKVFSMFYCKGWSSLQITAKESSWKQSSL